MRDLDAALSNLQWQMKDRLQSLDDLKMLDFGGLPPALADENRSVLLDRAERARRRCLAELENLITFSPVHLRHREHLQAFWEAGSYADSVFIMTKFPRDPGLDDRDVRLEEVISSVSSAVRDAGFVPRIARNCDYHSLLWDNVELHMLGCSRGIAIVEDKYLPELNPNVVMEWGWMRAMAKPVLYLLENDFAKSRADLSGLSSERFSWDDPGPGISAAVAAFLAGPGGRRT